MQEAQHAAAVAVLRSIATQVGWRMIEGGVANSGVRWWALPPALPKSEVPRSALLPALPSKKKWIQQDSTLGLAAACMAIGCAV